MEAETGIIVFGFTRSNCLKNLLESLHRQEALGSAHVWLDGHDGIRSWIEKVGVCRDVVSQYQVAEFVGHNGHLGIGKLMLDGLSAMSRRYEKIIVLEDDCFPTASAISTFERELDAIADRDDVYSAYGHHFLTPSEGETITRFQGWGWGWANTRQKLLPILEKLKACFMMSEAEYLGWVAKHLTPEIRARLDITPGRNVLDVVQGFFSWDSCTALLTAMAAMSHKKTPQRTVYNCGMGPDSGHFPLSDRLRHPPFNMIAPDEVWQWFDS